ncbi:fumarylacetoacetase [Pseudoblastomonas halimionae]|uniref:fumarylacetoacetase n=1 Tax=Alteriqipengyuania halimionae TaxID=1926630 RepID=A0A6I4U1W2_9SPHN|nr:fumarylacetoacetase [Alteriqipengyuania halimionae]MXP09898.1 fumarylacetoacetase [Alteriqipengyuania halimionae]
MTLTDHTHNPDARSWVLGSENHADFPIQNLPFAMFSSGGSKKRVGVAIGDMILDLAEAADFMADDARKLGELGSRADLNALFSCGAEAMRTLRHAIFDLLTDGGKQADIEPLLYRASECGLHMPFTVRDYTDFYTGINHATNVGKLFRPDNPLLPNYKFVPIGYHGRASSVRVSGSDVTRPKGQTKAPDADAPSVGPSKRLDYELEMAVWVGQGNELGAPIDIADAKKHIAGIGILNDWSARDLQAWEYQPLGPFLAKSFHSSVSPWVVTMDALAPFRVAQEARPEGDPAPLDYLFDEDDQATGALDVTMEVHLSTAKMRDAGQAPMCLSKGPMTAMYWTIAQLIAHHSSNGCDLNPGDLLGTGTLTGNMPDSVGSLLEITNGGKEPLALPNGETRTFLENGDEIIMTAYAEKAGAARIGFGECRGRIVEGPLG